MVLLLRRFSFRPDARPWVARPPPRSGKIRSMSEWTEGWSFVPPNRNMAHLFSSSLIEFYPHYQETLRESLRILVGDTVEKKVVIGMAKDGSGVGGRSSILKFSFSNIDRILSCTLRTPGHQKVINLERKFAIVHYSDCLNIYTTTYAFVPEELPQSSSHSPTATLCDGRADHDQIIDQPLKHTCDCANLLFFFFCLPT